MTEILSLNKQLVSERLINSAIEIFFTFNEPVSVHVLVSSAERILCDLCEKQGIIILDDAWVTLKEKGLWKKAKRGAYNFMKHASTDADFKLDFKFQINEYMIFLGVLRYKSLWKHETDIMKVFHCYFMFEHPQLFHLKIQNAIETSRLNSSGDSLRKMIWENREYFLRNSLLLDIPKV